MSDSELSSYEPFPPALAAGEGDDVAPLAVPVAAIPVAAIPVAAIPVAAIPVAAIPVADASFPRFCTTCGTAWDPNWIECGPCARRRQRSGAAPAGDLPLVDEGAGAIKSAAVLYFALLAVCMLGTLAGLAKAEPLTIDFGVAIGLTAVTLGWAIVSWREVLPLLRHFPAPGWFAAGLGMSFVTFAIGAAVIGAVTHAFKLPGEPLSKAVFEAGFGWGTVVLLTCVEPAIVEELAFRGVVFGGLRRALSPFETVLVSALMFMILHLSPARFPHTLALGLAAGFLRLRTKSLYPCILLHFAHNLMCVIAEWAHVL